MQIIPLKERIFEIIDGVMYVFEKGIEESGLSTNYYRKEKSRGNKRILFLDHPTDRRFNLVAYETLSEDHKQKIEARYGNPSDYVCRMPIKQMVKVDNKAEQFFLQYAFNGERKLPRKRVKQYTRAACWLNMLKTVEANRNKDIKALGITVPEFFNHVKELMQIEKNNGSSETYQNDYQLPGDFPLTYQRLRSKTAQYTTEGYSCLIEKMYGIQNALKITDDTAEAQLLTLIEDPHQYDDVMVAFLYNIWAKESGYKIIHPRTVCDWRLNKEYDITIGRYGNSAYNEKYIRQVKGIGRPKPLHLIEHDDYNLNLLFEGANNNPFKRYISIVVMDAHCDLVLGKSYHPIQKDMEDTLQLMIRHAHLDAMYYIRSIVNDGNWYAPFELKADHYAKKSMFPFYRSIANFVPPSVANKHRGYIEPFFGSPFLKRAEKLVSNGNWNGNNMSAKYTGVNPDMLELSVKEKSRPKVGQEAEVVVENFFHLLRHMPDIKRTQMNAPSKEQKWLSAWHQLSIEEKRPLTDEQFLLTYGIEHNPDRPITITNRGVEPQIAKNNYSFDLPESWMYNKLVGAKVNVIYDPFDMSRALITNNDDIRFIAKTAQLQPRTLKDQYTGSRTYLNAILAEKKDQVQKVSDSSAARKKIVNIDYYNAEAVLQGGTMIKELKNQAEQKLLEGTTGYEYDPFDDM